LPGWGLVLARREGPVERCIAGQTKADQEGKTMMSPRLFKSSIAITAIAGLVLSTAVLAQAPASDPYGPAGPPPDMQQQGQYAQQPQGYAQDPHQQQGPTAQQQADAVTSNQAPPPIPDYDQPEAPGDGYTWTPGYWAWNGIGYEWVQGAWVEPPYSGALWTPGYWGYGYNAYSWYPGYWGPFVGYYGGLNYGFGYFGIGFYGGYWFGGHFWYNRAYCNIGHGYGFHSYTHSYAGFNGHAGGSSFVHATSVSANRGVGSAAGYRGSSINGRSTSYGQGASRQGAGQGAVRSNYAGSAYNGARSYSGASNYAGGARSYAQPSYNGGAHYSAPAGGGAHYAAPSGGSYGGGAHYSAPAGGGFHGGGGGGGGFHGGGGGGGHR
jgi:hypothetical protein